jgi:hypothetical protein
MTRAQSPLTRAADRLLAALQRETAIARLGALPELSAAADAKRAALADFTAACETRGDAPPDTLAAEREALRRVISAADQNALVLVAVRRALEDLPRRLRAAITAAVDPGVYTLHGRTVRHVLAARINASA